MHKRYIAGLAAALTVAAGCAGLEARKAEPIHRDWSVLCTSERSIDAVFESEAHVCKIYRNDELYGVLYTGSSRSNETGSSYYTEDLQGHDATDSGYRNAVKKAYDSVRKDR